MKDKRKKLAYLKFRSEVRKVEAEMGKKHAGVILAKAQLREMKKDLKK